MTMLLKTSAELKQFTPVSVALEPATLKPFITQGECVNEIVSILGRELWEELLEAYDEDSLTPDLEALLPFVQFPLYNLGVYAYLAHGSTTITDGGIVTNRTNTAFQWQTQKVQDSLMRRAYNGMDELLRFLVENQDAYDGWAESEANAEQREMLVPDAKTFSKWVNIKESRRTYMALKSVMRQVEESYVRELLGSELFDELKEESKTGELSEDNETLARMLESAICHLTIAEGVEDVNLDLSAEGAVLVNIRVNFQNEQERIPGTPEVLSRMAMRHRERGQAQMNRVKKYLDTNASTELFPTYYAGPNYDGPGAIDPRMDDSNNDNAIFNAL